MIAKMNLRARYIILILIWQCVYIPTQANEVDSLEMDSVEYLLKDIYIEGQRSQLRKTPISSTNITGVDIEERIGNQELVEVLKATPSIHANKQGGGWGDSEIFLRGFDNSNVSVLINGISVNDMENGSVYWSNWAELGDVAASVQVQRGIGANIVSSPSIGGSINIVTNGIETRQKGYFSYMCGNDGYNKITLSYSTGLIKGWALSLKASRTWGDGYAVGTSFEAYSYFINLAKRINDNHQLTLVAFGSPQQHYMRSYALTQSEWEKTKNFSSFGKDWKCYNPDYGFDSKSQRKSSDFNKYHKPFISLNHIWQIDYISSLSTNIYASIGYGYSYTGDANSTTYSEYDWCGSNEGILNTKFRKTDGTFDYAKIEQLNQNAKNGSEMVLAKMLTKFQWYGIVSNYSAQFLDCLNVSSGVDFRYFKGTHTNVISDLFAGSYFIDPVRANVSLKDNSFATDTWKNTQLHEGDVVHRDYDCNIIQTSLFGQLEYAKDNITAFITGTFNYQAMWRYDRLFYDADHAKSDNVNLFGGTIKIGANYNFAKYNNIYANMGYISKVPPFKNGVFMSANTSNIINRDVKNEKAASAELGYGFHCKYISINFAGYFTEWMDKTMTKKGTLEDGAQYFMNMQGVNARHMGVELEISSTPTKWLELNAMVSLGSWKWDSDSVKSWAYDSYGQALSADGTITTSYSPSHAWAIINMKGINVGGSAQTTAAFSTIFKPYKGIRIGAEYNLYDRNYAYYSLSGNKLKLGQTMNVSNPWRIPLGGQLDLRFSYTFQINQVQMLLSAQVNNVINQTYIEKAWNPSNVSTDVKVVDPNAVYFFYAQGRSWNVKFKISI